MSAPSPVVVIGGGFFGCELAVRLARRFDSVTLFEAGPDIMTRASYRNQARVHGGYHYPRSVLTGLRSRVSYPRFKADYAACIDDRFAKYYAIARRFSKVTAGQFAAFCRRIGAACAPAPNAARALFDFERIDEAFLVDECAFDADRLRELVRARLQRAGVDLHLNCAVQSVRGVDGDRIAVNAGQNELAAATVILCVYGQTNRFLEINDLPPAPLKHELTELALVEMPPELRSVGVTVMCGPFFSCMPFPARGLHSLSHVRFTPHCAWTDGEAPSELPPSNAALMLRDAIRFVPALARARYVDSLWEVKSVLVQSESDDSRPILFSAHHGLRNLHCVLGSKIDNVYDALDHVERVLEHRSAA